MTPVTQASKSVAPAAKRTESPDPAHVHIRDLIYKISGIYQPEEKLYLLADACSRRMKEIDSRSPRDYWDFLTHNPNRDGEVRQLLNEITIGETCLFRSVSQMDALRKVVLPEFTRDKARQILKKLRIWSAGCSTGEEPYTVAMALLEESEHSLKGWHFEILATDLNDRSVEAAKAGVYGDYALRNTTEHFRKKYFQPADGGKLQVRPEVKQKIVFNRLNLHDDSKMVFMKGIDLIFCCNVLIYFDSASKSRVVGHFFNNLNAGGYVFLGASESLLRLNDQFHLVHFPGAIGYWKPPRDAIEKGSSTGSSTPRK